MAVYEMRAEYARGTTVPGGVVKHWHMTRDGGLTGLCGHELTVEAETLSDEAWGTTREPFCHLCGALYLRQVP
jgi:hypothetical protein